MKNHHGRVRRLEDGVGYTRTCAVCGSVVRGGGRVMTVVIQPVTSVPRIGGKRRKLPRCRGCGLVDGQQVYEIAPPTRSVMWDQPGSTPGT